MSTDWLTPDNLSKLIRVITLILSLWTGSLTAQGTQAISSREGGFSAAPAAATQTVGVNAVLTLILATVFAKPQATAEMVGKLLGTGVATTATYCTNIAILQKQWQLAGPDARKSLKQAAVDIVTKDMFPDDEPPAGKVASS